MTCRSHPWWLPSPLTWASAHSPKGVEDFISFILSVFTTVILDSYRWTWNLVLDILMGPLLCILGKNLLSVPEKQCNYQRIGDQMSYLRFGIEDQSLVQSISYPLYKLLPDAILQKLLRIHLRHHSGSVK